MLIKEENYKVNFIDENDVFVGYDMRQCCCEDAGYFISESANEPYSYDGNASIDCVDGYIFDVNFFGHIESRDLDSGGQVCFRLTKGGCEDLYLHLHNSHNGYYSHGFQAMVGGETWQSGVL